MAFDVQRVVEAAARAALEDGDPGQRQPTPRRRRLSAPRALLIGAGLLTAGRLVASSRGRDLVEALEERLDDFRERQLGGRDDDEYEDDYDEPEDEDEDEPENEDDEEEDEPEPARNRARSGRRATSRRR